MRTHRIPLSRGGLALVIAVGIPVATDAQAEQGGRVDSLAEYIPTGNEPFDSTVVRFLTKTAPKIIGGEPAPDGAYPWHVSLLVEWVEDPVQAHFCGGSIVNANWVRTAAHCLRKLEKEHVTVISGTNVLDERLPRKSVDLLIVHRDYNLPKRHDNDIALIRVTTPFDFGHGVRPIRLPDPEQVFSEGQEFFVAGWGATIEGGVSIPELHHLSVPFVTREQCNDPLSYYGRITANMLCAGDLAGGSDPCQADSGGALVDLSDSSEPIQIGVTSWGEGCARPGKVTVYADGQRYREWEETCIYSRDSCR